jgi:hypothetical protein
MRLNWIEWVLNNLEEHRHRGSIVIVF